MRGARTEEDVRLQTYGFLQGLATELGLNIRMRNERVVLTGGRIDSMFDNIIFEFKKPDHFRTQIGIDEAVIGRKSGEKRRGGLIEYLLSVPAEESSDVDDFLRHLSAKLGVGFDGSSFIFVRYVPSETHEIPLDAVKERLEKPPAWLPDQVDGEFNQTVQADPKAGLRFLYLHMRAISPKDPLTPANVSRRFSEKSSDFAKHVNVIYSLLWKSLQRPEPHVETLYSEWYRVFGKVYGDIGGTTREVREQLMDDYKDSVDFSKNGGLDLQRLIFSIHTYYNIILKMLVSELLSSLLNPFTRQGTTLALSDREFRQRVTDTMRGEYFRVVGIENFFETGFFEWWTYVWDDEFSSMLREVIQLMEQMEITTSILKPELIGDTVKETYHSLMPGLLRHFLGEYFTPDWLAECAVNLSGFQGGLDETFLDPACGSGTFLALAIKRKMLANPKVERKALVQGILKTVVGFDLNPISVIASKTNYLLTLGDLSEMDFTVKIPVFQCDAILTPAVHAKQLEDAHEFTIDTFCGAFTLPALPTRDDIEELLDVVKVALDNEFNEEEFSEKVELLGKDISIPASLKLYRKIVELTEKERNGLWIPILKNAFAPVYSRSQFDFVVGNPPWVSWRSMSKSYRDLTLPIWLSYDIFNKSAYDKATTHDDFAMALRTSAQTTTSSRPADSAS